MEVNWPLIAPINFADDVEVGEISGDWGEEDLGFGVEPYKIAEARTEQRVTIQNKVVRKYITLKNLVIDRILTSRQT